MRRKKCFFEHSNGRSPRCISNGSRFCFVTEPSICAAKVTRARTKGPTEDVSRTKITDWTEVEAQRCSRRNIGSWHAFVKASLVPRARGFLIHVDRARVWNEKKKERKGVEIARTQRHPVQIKNWRGNEDSAAMKSDSGRELLRRSWKTGTGGYKVALIQKFL